MVKIYLYISTRLKASHCTCELWIFKTNISHKNYCGFHSSLLSFCANSPISLCLFVLPKKTFQLCSSIVKTERHVFHCSLMFKIHLIVCFHYFSLNRRFEQAKNINYFVLFYYFTGELFQRFFFCHIESCLVWSQKRALNFFLLHQNVIYTRSHYSFVDSKQAAKQQLDLHRFYKLAIYRLMFVSLNHVPSLLLPHRTVRNI